MPLYDRAAVIISHLFTTDRTIHDVSLVLVVRTRLSSLERGRTTLMRSRLHHARPSLTTSPIARLNAPHALSTTLPSSVPSNSRSPAFPSRAAVNGGTNPSMRFFSSASIALEESRMQDASSIV